MPDPLDASVWLPLSAPDHQHHLRARSYWEEEAEEELWFCQVTALALLRHLTNSRILGSAVLDGAEAWRALLVWMAVPRIRLRPEPPGIHDCLDRWAHRIDLRRGAWTDAYLAAFAVSAGCRLVTFDTGFAWFPDLRLLLLRP